MLIDKTKALAAIDALPEVAPTNAAPETGDVPRVTTYQVITSKLGNQRNTYVGSLPGGGPWTFNQPERGTLTGTAPNLTYRATSAGQDTFTVRTADGRLHAFFVSVSQ